MDEEIRVKACLAVVHNHSIFLVQRTSTESGEIYWSLPGGRVHFGKSVDTVALRYFEEETGLHAQITGFLDVNENILPNKPYHSLTITLFGTLENSENQKIEGILSENARMFTINDLKGVDIRPEQVILKALGVT